MGDKKAEKVIPSHGPDIICYDCTSMGDFSEGQRLMHSQPHRELVLKGMVVTCTVCKKQSSIWKDPNPVVESQWGPISSDLQRRLTQNRIAPEGGSSG